MKVCHVNEWLGDLSITRMMSKEDTFDSAAQAAWDIAKRDKVVLEGSFSDLRDAMVSRAAEEYARGEYLPNYIVSALLSEGCITSTQAAEYGASEEEAESESPRP